MKPICKRPSRWPTRCTDPPACSSTSARPKSSCPRRLHDLTKSTSASTAELAAATNMFNPGCERGADLAALSPVQQMKIVATRCSLDGEILVYVARVGSSTALLPWEGSAFFMDPADLAPGNGANVRLAHEIGHYIGLPNVFGCCSDNDLSHANLVAGNIRGPPYRRRCSLVDVLGSRLRDGWARRTNVRQASSASNFEIVPSCRFRPPERSDLTTGWYCPSGDVDARA